MKQYIGTKVVNATPMTRLDYNIFRKRALPADEDGADEGYLVEYVDGGKANTPEYAGYVSWSPKEVFYRSYKETIGASFEVALQALKLGCKVSRLGWNGKGMFLFLVAGATFTEITYHSHVAMRTADGTIVPWLCSQTDLLAEDWMISPA